MEEDKLKYFYLYKVEDRFWAYDRFSNLIVEVDEPTYHILYTFNDHHFKQDDLARVLKTKFKTKLLYNKLKEIKIFQKKHNAFLPFDLKESNISYSKKELRTKYENEVRHIIFNITDDCNLRCKYCKFTGTYNGARTHRKHSMSYDTINNSLKLIQSLYKGKDTLIIGFYGGEPLLEFEKIKYIVSVLENNYSDLRIGLTTNGTMLDKKVIEYLIQHNIMIKISLDGPKNIHDRNRITKSGSGSFDLIMKNIEIIKKIDFEYFKKLVGFIITISPPYDLTETINFFEKNVENSQPVIFSYVDPYDTNYFDYFNMEKESNKLSGQLNILRNEYFRLKIDRIQNNRVKLLEDYFGSTLLKFDQRNISALQSHNIFPNAICMPGLDRLFITTEGKLGMCEKVGNSLIIGDVKNGFDHQKIKKIIDEYCKIVNKVCLDCWAYRLCSSCFISALKNNELNSDRKKEDCRARKASIIKNLILYTRIKMYNNNAFCSEITN